ncbi:MAG: heme-degrading domain-containing protein [Devosia sp.]|nr:heme-degrading domain-containing protein [Devosia sp.]
MALDDDIAKIAEQERALVFERFDEIVAQAIGSAIWEYGRANGLTLVVDIRFWDRTLFYAALPGTTADNAEWVRRKSNSVKVLRKSTYRLVLEKTFEGRAFPAERALDSKDYVLAGGSFPVQVQGIGVVGSITVSGLAERDDHGIVVAAIARYLGLDADGLALSS